MKIRAIFFIFLLCVVFLFCISIENSTAQGGIEAKLAAAKIYETNIRPITALLLTFFIFLIAIIPRTYFLLPFILVAVFIPADQRFILKGLGLTEGLDFSILRILILAGMLRLFIRSEWRFFKLTTFDKILIGWALGGSAIYFLRELSAQALINRLGFLFDVFGMYWLFRQLMRSWSDIKWAIKLFAICILFFAPFVVIERLTESNPFSVLGRAESAWRAGGLRCSGAFPHPIIMGIFWASLFPLFVGMYRISKNKIFYMCTILVCAFSVFASNSSTPIALLIIAFLLLPLYGAKVYTWLGVKLLFILALLAQLFKSLTGRPPLWHAIARVRITSGSTGYYRYLIIDRFIKRFNEWWLLGTKDTASWDTWGRTADITNQYVLEGIRGGFLGLVLFLSLLISAFKCLVRNFLEARSSEEQWLSWCLWIVLVCHMASFIGVSHFGQISMLWYLQLAMVGFIYEKQTIEEKNK